VSALTLHLTRHPLPRAQASYDALVGLDEHKRDLVDQLVLALDPKLLDAWRDKHHRKGLALLERLRRRAPLVLLTGEVGCGKTALAGCVGTPLAERLKRPVEVFESPSDIRGTGLVGEISARITEAFSQSLRKLSARAAGLLVIDEADDLATARSQMQAHHEDRAGLNVLIKQIDRVAREEAALAVILITNRVEVLDPAVRRRAMLHLTFRRPDTTGRRALLSALLEGTGVGERSIASLVKRSEREVPYSASDLFERVGQRALMSAWQSNEPLSAEHVRAALDVVEPTPLLKAAP